MRQLRSYALLLLVLVVQGIQARANTSTAVESEQDTTTLRQLTAQGRALLYQRPDTALLMLMEATKLAERLHQPAMQAESMAWSAVAYYVLGEYDQAMPLFIEARRLAEETQNHNGLATALNGMGLIYQTQHMYQKAISLHKQAIIHARSIPNMERVTANRFNIGLAFDELGQYDSSLFYLRGALQLSREHALHRLLLMSLNRLAKVHFHLKAYDKADSLYNVALNYSELEDNWEKCFSWAGLAELNDAQGRYRSGIENGLRSLAIARQMHAKWDVIHAAQILSQLYAHQHAFEQAYEMMNTAQAYKDSVFNEEKENKLNYIELKETELAKARLEHENVIQLGKIKEKNSQIIIAVIVVGALLIVVLIINSRQRHKALLSKQLLLINQMMERQNNMVEKQNKELLELNQTKNRLLSIISHDMRGPFNTLRSMLELLRMGGLDESQQQMVFKDLSETFRSVSGTLEGLLQWAHSQMNGLEATPQVLAADDIIEKAVHFWEPSAFKKALRIHHKPRGHAVYADGQKLETVVRNIVGNAIKFTPSEGSISIDTVQRDNRTGIVVRDTGMGMPSGMRDGIFTFQKENRREGTLREKGSGLGLMISHQLTLKNGGDIEVESEEGKGSTFTIWLPSEKPGE
ncbi:MAG TPA: tetratricopeptide repeat-containing sensor histidine kinase [Chryseolinea sp.]|nr:tetratricopeptide repeat-containing sensor histidine kinase [Chryseolinea sp.]